VRALALLALVLLAAGCGFGGSKEDSFTGSVAFTLPKPPAESTWPQRPTFDAHSCWTRPVGGGAIPSAPSYERKPTGLAPEAVVAKVLQRLGDRRFVTNVRLAPVAPVKLLRVKGYFAGRRPPDDARWGWIGTRGGSNRTSPGMLPGWEAQLVGGALRDELCAAGGPPLVGWTVPGRNEGGFSDPYNVYGQRFPNPSPAAFRKAVTAAGRASGFRPGVIRL
jgi:hypothetical protein